ncbi:hypothetical protein [Alteribacillus bidgolensis]|uniref:NADH:flavin oxidoreductase / NADH oxidase family protein n=1 Tax=Alteribacillus bidgolensis TaxID=930129 RepID=A0A1G8I6A9_9BACI|nr:hypothetical protein [Alteribacillus bidgolensis]SDI14495.1 NADH:flavin oxidoreductase / NADH oxidase family protein [Alteribacillus bidgolensis]
MILGLRVSQLKATNPHFRWSGGEKDAETIFSALGNSDVDYIHLSDDDAATSGFGEGTMTMSKAVKKFTDVSVIACGSLSNPEKAASLIDQQAADFVAIARQALANPDTPNRVRKNRNLDDFDKEKIILPKAYVKDFELEQELVRED